MATIDTRALTDEQRAAFIAGWIDAGGRTDDMDGPAPWCAPWEWAYSIEVTGADPYDWGRQWWHECRDEINAIDEQEREDG